MSTAPATATTDAPDDSPAVEAPGTSLAPVIPLPIPRGALSVGPHQDAFTEAQLEVLVANGAKVGGQDGMTPAALTHLLHICQVKRLDPFSGDITMMPTGDGWIPIIKIGGLERLASATGEFEGFTEPEWIDDQGEFYPVWPKGMTDRPYGARIGAFRTGYRQSTMGVVYTEEVEVWETPWEEQTRNGVTRKVRGTPRRATRWTRGNGVLNLVMKCAKAAALRDAFPEACGGLYVPEEVGRVRAERRATEADRQHLAALTRIRAAQRDAQDAESPAGSGPRPVVESKPVSPAGGAPVLEGSVVETTGEAARRLRVRAQERAAEAREMEQPLQEELVPTGPGNADRGDDEKSLIAETPEAQASCLVEEIGLIAEILGVPVDRVTARLGKPPHELSVTALSGFVMPLRRAVVARLRTDGRSREADSYAACAESVIAPPDVLLGRASLSQG